MKITSQQLNKIIKEELNNVINETSLGTAQNLMDLISDLSARVEALENQNSVTELPDLGHITK